MSRVVSVKVKDIRPQYDNLREWMKDPKNIYIGRGRVVFIDGEGERFPPLSSPWANPFRVGKDGTREEVINRYRSYITTQISFGHVDLEELRGKVLGCWCKTRDKPDTPCHGDVLMDLLFEKDMLENIQNSNID